VHVLHRLSRLPGWGTAVTGLASAGGVQDFQGIRLRRRKRLAGTGPADRTQLPCRGQSWLHVVAGEAEGDQGVRGEQDECVTEVDRGDAATSTTVLNGSSPGCILLVRRCVVPASYEEFVAARLPAVLRYATALTGSPQLAEDVVQEVLVRAQARWRRIADMERPEAYLRRMVLNEYLGWRRRRVSRDVAMPDTEMERLAPPLADPAAGHGDREQLRRALAGLPRRQRAVLVLRYFEGLSDLEIAADLGCATGTVRSHASRALATLRAALEDEEETAWT
jgi:RNA polymerase sigma-70 factor (sigma-E family)